MKLKQLYSNSDTFHNVKFNDGLNVVLGKVYQKYDKLKDSHNLGKSTLIEILDFMLLKDIDKEHIFKKFYNVFQNHIFYLESELNNGTYLTIKRNVAEPNKVSFKENLASTTCNNTTVWNISDISRNKAEEWLNSKIGFDVLTDWKYRKTVSFFLRTQRDYQHVFQLGKFQNGKHKDWKPVVFELIGYNSQCLKDKYELDQQIKDLKRTEQDINKEMAVHASDFDKIKGLLDLKKAERDDMKERVDAFNFYAEERSLNKNLVEDIEKRISDLNTREYALSYDLEKTKASIKNIPNFNIEQLKKLYEEVEIYFPDSMIHGYEELVDFNKKVTEERNQYLKEQSEAIENELQSVRNQLEHLNTERNEALSVLQDKDTFRKFKGYQMKLAALEGEISRLELELHNIDAVANLNERADAFKQEQKEVCKEIAAQLKANDNEVAIKIKRIFNEIFQTVFGVSALLYVKPNKSGNVDFMADVAETIDSDATAEGLGNTYLKMLCASFDIALLASYSSNSFFRFVYHDGILEGLDNRKKELFISLVRSFCKRYKIQYIFSSIEDDIPSDILKNFTAEEKCLELNDKDDSGKLFGFSF